LSRGTVRKAYDALAAERLIRREQGKGIFVNASPATLSGFHLAEGPAQAGRSIEVKVLQFETIAATPTLSERLGVKLGAELLHVTQVLVLNGLPVMHEVRYMARALCPDLSREMIERHGMHWLLMHHYRLPLVRVTHDIQLVRATKAVAISLEIRTGATVFAIDRLTYTSTGFGQRARPAVLYSAFCREDQYQFQADFRSFL